MVFTGVLLTLILWTPSHLLHESDILRDQVCPSSNKRGCFDMHPLFAAYKFHPLDHTAHLSPPPSCRLATGVFVQQHPHKVRMRLAATAPLLVGENGFAQLNDCLRFLSLQASFVSDRLTASTKGYSDFAFYCSGFSTIDARRNIQAAINVASNCAVSRAFKFFLETLRPLEVLIPEREKRSQPSS